VTGKKRVTIKQVAHEAGVSTQTVSRVINDRPDVAPETRKRVLGVIERMGYQPSAIARSLIQKRSYTLGVVIAGLKYIGPSRTLNGITGQADKKGYTLLLKELPDFVSINVKPILDSLMSRQVDGIIWGVPEVGDNRDWLKDNLPELPVPVIFLTMGPIEGLPLVAIDNYMGGRLATEHLIEQGCRRIAHITGPLDWWEARERKRGWQDAITDVGFRLEDVYCVNGNWSTRSGEKAILRLMDEYPEMEAVFVGNDQMALSVLQHACRRGIQVPQELAVVGFDDIEEAAYFWPPLSTVSQDQNELGCTAVRELVHIIEASRQEGVEYESKIITLQPRLVARESSVEGGKGLA
jgi:DNA-binding LacI/PurR family transcriptional regulator